MLTETKKDILLKMQDDLKEALSKPKEKRKWAMVIDLRKCVACFACTIACKAENVLPPGVVYRRVLDIESGKYPDVKREFVPIPCMQCENPPCVSVCPVKATFKRPDGIVAIDYKKCIGCKYCIIACPYNARKSDKGKLYTEKTPRIQEYELRPNYEYGETWKRKKGKSPIGNPRKCHFCIHRIEKGLLPACVVTCIGRATYFGDINNRDSLIAAISMSLNKMCLKPEEKTKPNVYYLI